MAGGRSRIAMTDDERDAFLDEERVARLATVDARGWPAVVPVWFVWHDGDFWVWNLDRAKRTRRLEAGTRVALVVDAGVEYQELRGVHAQVDYEFVDNDRRPPEVARAFARKYMGADHLPEGADDHTWLRLPPRSIRSWDFRKVMPQSG